MAPRGKVDDDTFGGDDDQRLHFALNLKEGLTPDACFDDWGDKDVDHPIEPQQEGLKASSVEEIEDFYNQSRQNTFRLTDHDHEG